MKTSFETARQITFGADFFALVQQLGKTVTDAIACRGFNTRSSRDFAGNLPALASCPDSLR